MRIVIPLFFVFGLQLGIHAQNGRQTQSINDNWSFHIGEINDDSNWKTINLPHSWNTKDPFDEDKGYYRNEAWYKRKLEINNTRDRKWFLHFEGVNQVAEVYVNGTLAGKHIGGYTAFNINLSKFLRKGVNELKIKVDNSHDDSIIPLKGDFNFYGGIYRDVWLISTDKTHFSFSEYGDRGVFITTPKVTQEEASIEVRSHIMSENNQESTLRYELFEPDGKQVFSDKKEINLREGHQIKNHELPTVSKPELWSPDQPNLYQLKISVINNHNDVIDQQIIPMGFRWFRFDPDKGFFINGEHLKLIGANRHQDYKGLGNALSDQRHIGDVKRIKAMGSNFFRTAHYPQDPSVMQASDQLGLLVSVEIPLDHEITDSEAFYTNAKHMMKEMIRQNYNHPSIIIWAYMNEMLLGRQLDKDQKIITKIVDFARVLEKLAREEDNTRYTMIPNHGDLKLYYEAGLTQIPMLVGWNLYYGWYEEELGAGKFLDAYHILKPNTPMLITEYGAGADSRIHSFHPVRFDFSLEWQTQYHQKNLIDIMYRPFVAGAAVWNLADFGSEERNDAVPKINSKGLMGFNRKPKDSYFLYQSWLKDEPYLNMASSDWIKREAYESSQPIRFFTNGKSIELKLNGQEVNYESFENHLAEWKVNLQIGINTFEAKVKFQDTTITKYSTIEYSPIDSEWISNKNTLLVNCGANFFFIDPVDQVTWQPEKAYKNQLFGFSGGDLFQPRERGIGTDRQIFLTDNDPIYQTARIGGTYQFDFAAGEYEVVLHWAEIDQNYGKDYRRIFDVLFNDKVVLENFDLGRIDPFTAFSKKFIIQIKDNGLEISFRSKQGEALLNGIGIRKL